MLTPKHSEKIKIKTHNYNCTSSRNSKMSNLEKKTESERKKLDCANKSELEVTNKKILRINFLLFSKLSVFAGLGQGSTESVSISSSSKAKLPSDVLSLLEI